MKSNHNLLLVMSCWKKKRYNIINYIINCHYKKIVMMIKSVIVKTFK